MFACKEKRLIDTIKESVENFYSFEQTGNLHLADDTNDSDDQKSNDYLIITLEEKYVKEKIDESEQIGLEMNKNLDVPIVIDDEQYAEDHQF